MKTSLTQHRDLVKEIQKVNLIQGIKLLRDFLKDNGYEGDGPCKHYAILRTTGRCMNCKAEVTEPIVIGSDEALEALRERLGG